MRRFILLSACALVTLIPAQAKRKHKHGAMAVNTVVVFGAPEREAILGYYRAKPLPPGLAKQLRRNGRLPPGIEKKMVVFPVDLERRLPPLPPDCGCSRGLIDGQAVILNSRTRVVIDVLALF